MLLILIVAYATASVKFPVIRGLIAGFYILRTLRIFQLLSDWRRFQVIMVMMRDSRIAFVPLFTLMCVGILVSSTCVYYSEAGQPDSQVTSIPGAYWWSVVTIATVGYGDVTPVGGWGKLVGSIWAILGLVFVGLPIPVLFRNYSRAHAMCDLQDDLLKKARRALIQPPN